MSHGFRRRGLAAGTRDILILARLQRWLNVDGKMANETKQAFLHQLKSLFGTPARLEGSQSLFEIPGTSTRLYVRYSRVHPHGRTFYGLREADLRQLDGVPSLVCFLWDGQKEPLLVPYSDYEDVWHSTTPASDGQYKVQVYTEGDDTELYIAQAGRFNVDGNMGWEQLRSLVEPGRGAPPPELSHEQTQTMLGAIGAHKGYDVWVPLLDRARLDWSVARRYDCRDSPPPGFGAAERILQEIDVVWVRRGSSEVTALFEIEHSTPVYSGLLRLNDVHLVAPHARPRFCVVANDVRRGLFARQVNRPTFQASGLSGLCAFLDYTNVYGWYTRLMGDPGRTGETPALQVIGGSL